ncbi:MAG: HD domain-containing protein [Nitrospira sp.]|nr:HD domain-containing protein [Nitrospira sp.]
MNLYRRIEEELMTVAAAVQAQRPFPIERLESLRDGLVSSLKRSDELVVHALSGPAGSPLITNLINVGILGTKVGIGLGYYGEELDRLALAGLLHDVGLFAVQQSLLTKVGRLTQEERVMIEQHPALGCELVQKLGVQYDWLAQVVEQAHERFNGKGYPNQLKGAQVGEMAQVIGVVDVFDALVSERPYHRRLFPHEAVKELLVAERTAFPREVLKALVEQLTVYPLGTTVRLTTGETARVCRVNSRYPLRPTVEVVECDAGEEVGGRQMDLSLTPLLSIIETVNPPSIENRVIFEPPTEPERSGSPGVASDQFTALLESLDAIVSAIRGVVATGATVSPAHTAQTVEREKPTGTQGEAKGGDEQALDQEIVGLFALEAHEWLRQIQTALNKLGAGAEGAVRSKLYGFTLNGITNLGRSASTVHLSDIETMASNLLPVLRDVGRTQSRWTMEILGPLHHGLDRIAGAVRRLTGESAGREQPVDTHSAGYSLSSQYDVDSGRHALDPLAFSDRPEATLPLLKALRDLQEARARLMEPARDVLESVIERAQHEVGEGQDHVAVEVVARILRDLDETDEEFLQEIHERIPSIIGRVAHLRESGKVGGVTPTDLDQIYVHIDTLKHLARTNDAKTIVLLLQGIKSLLINAADRNAEAFPERLQAVGERIKWLIPMTEQWVTLGRLERASIQEILPA